MHIMQSLTIRGNELELIERPTPSPGGDQILVEVAAAGLNRADLMQVAGQYPPPPGWPDDVPGIEFAGTVAAIGAAVHSLQVGDRVFGLVGGGGHASHLITSPELCVRVPDDMNMTAAGGAPEAFITAHDALVTQGEVRYGERVLIHGVGSGVGVAAVQIASMMGAPTVATSRTPEKLMRAAELGLDRGVVGSRQMAAEIGEVDVVVDMVCGDYLATDIEVCRSRGRVVLVGLLAGARAELDLAEIIRKRVTVRGTTLRIRPFFERVAAIDRFAREVVPELGRRLNVVVDRTFPLTEAEKAYDYMASNEGYGKTILTMTDIA